ATGSATAAATARLIVVPLNKFMRASPSSSRARAGHPLAMTVGSPAARALLRAWTSAAADAASFDGGRSEVKDSTTRGALLTRSPPPGRACGSGASVHPDTPEPHVRCDEKRSALDAEERREPRDDLDEVGLRADD